MMSFRRLVISTLPALLFLLMPVTADAQYQFGYLSYRKAIQSMPEYPAAQTALRALREKYDSEAKYNEEKFKKMFADFLDGQKNFPQAIMLKRQKELQVAMEQGVSFRKDAERLLTQAESELITPLENKLDSILAMIGSENGLIFIVNTDNHDFPFIHTQAGKDLHNIVMARLEGKVLPLVEEEKPADAAAPAEAAPATPATAPAEQKAQN